MFESATGRYLIPAGTQPSTCESCHARIYWIEHTRKPRNKADHPVPKPFPISVPANHVHALEPTKTTFGKGISHVADCPHAAQHVKGAKDAPIARHSPGGPVHAKLELVS